MALDAFEVRNGSRLIVQNDTALALAHAGRKAAGQHGHYFTMASDIVRFAGSLYRERFAMLARQPFNWHHHAVCAGAVIELPLVLAHGHFRGERHFNEQLRLDLVSRPPTMGAMGAMEVA